MPVFGNRTQLDEESIQSLANNMLSRGYAVKTVIDTLLMLKMILRFGEKMQAWPHIEYSVHFPAQVEGQHPVQTLSIHDQLKLIRHLQENFSFRNLGIRICLESGMRIGEICGLQWKDIDLTEGVIQVRKTVQKIYVRDGQEKESYLSVGSPKTASSSRDIPMSIELKALLRPFKKVMNPDHYILSNSKQPLLPGSYRDYYYRILRELDIPHIQFHALRHSFATRCIESKCDYKTVSVILGHASLATTMDLYVHPGLEEKKRCINRLAKALQVCVTFICVKERICKGFLLSLCNRLNVRNLGDAQYYEYYRTYCPLASGEPGGFQ